MICNQCGAEIPEGYAACPLCYPQANQPAPVIGSGLFGSGAGPSAPGPQTPGAYAPLPPGGYAQPGGYGPPSYYPAAPSTNGFAIASLVCSILGLCMCGVPSLLGLIFGFVALSQINNSGGVQPGRGLAIAGIVIGAIDMLIVVAYFLLYLIGIVASLPQL